jgi:hypothetical protein
MSSKTMPRLQLPLSERDYADLEMLKRSPENMQQMNINESTSNAALALAVFEEGLRVVKERIAEASYSAMGRDAEEKLERDAERRRLTRRSRDFTVD